MEIKYFRSSSYNCYSLCPMQYYLKYVLGLDDRMNLKALTGTVVHKILEILAIQKRNLQNGKPFYEVDDPTVSLYIPGKDIFAESNTQSIIDSVFNYYKDSDKYVKLGPKEYKIIVKYVNKVFDFRGGIFDPRKLNIVAPETYFDFPIERDWARLDNKSYLRIKGTIDLTTKIDDNTYELLDWKTGQYKSWKTGELKTFEDFEEDFQLNLYFYALSKIYPSIKQFIITIYHIQFDKPFTMAFDTDNIIKTENMIRDRLNKIQNDTNPAKLNTWFCSTICPYNKFSNDCENITRELKIHGMDETTKKYGKLKDLGFYKNPGE